MKQHFDQVSAKISRAVTAQYSTSFSLGIRFLHSDFRDPIHAIYGFVRLADEVVDSFHDFDKADLLCDFRQETFLAIKRGISLNPVLNSFQAVVSRYNIGHDLIHAFLRSMEMDLEKRTHDENTYKDYILGSAEVVGLMCLQVFVEGDAAEYDRLRPYAMRLGAAFQKINFLRDLRADYLVLGRVYFPNVNMNELNEHIKADIESDIEQDFEAGLAGIRQLPRKARLGVYVAYIYYRSLFVKIKKTKAHRILESRIRIPNGHKVLLFAGSYVRNTLNLL